MIIRTGGLPKKSIQIESATRVESKIVTHGWTVDLRCPWTSILSNEILAIFFSYDRWVQAVGLVTLHQYNIVSTAHTLQCDSIYSALDLKDLSLELPGILQCMWQLFVDHFGICECLNAFQTVVSAAPASAKCKSVRKPYANLPDTPVAHTSASKYFQMLAAPLGLLQGDLRLRKSIHRCSWKHLQRWRWIQDATRFDDWNIEILELLTPLCRSAGDFKSSWDHSTGLQETSRAAETSAQALRETWCHILTPVVLGVPQPQGISSVIFVFATVTRFATS